MALQDKNLVMTGLSVSGDNPPNILQPPLKDGIHLRWAFPLVRGFPWHGFYLFRRLHHRQDPARIKDELQGFSPGSQGTKTITTQRSQISSDTDLLLTDLYPPNSPDGKLELSLSSRSRLRVDLGAGSLASELSAHLFSIGSNETTIPMRLFFDQMPAWTENIVIPAGSEAIFRWKFDGIKGIEFGSAPLLLVDVEFVPVGRGANVGWTKVPDFPYPLTLPLTRPDYPATAGIAEDLKAARTTARDRIDRGGYADPDRFAPAPVAVYSQGSIDLTQGSPLVRGNGTSWTTNLAGCLLQVIGEKTAYTIMAVLAADRLVLSRNYDGASATGLGYEISQDPFGQLHDLLTHLTRYGNAATPLPMNDRWLPEPVHEQGTIDVVQNSEKVGGLGTAWDEMLEGLILEIEIKTGSSIHRIGKVTSSTQLLIDPPYPGSSASGLRYHILPPLTPDNPADSDLEAVRQKPLDLLLLGALHPAVAQMLGLYWADQSVNQVDAYDYLIVATHKDLTGGSPDKGQGFLDWLQSNPTGLDDPSLDAYIVYNQKIGTPTPLNKPAGLAAYALPTASYTAPGAAGLHWDLGEYDRHALLPGKPVLYHVLRADLGSIEPAVRPAATAYNLITADRPVIVLHSDPPGKALPRRNDWPPLRLHYMDQGLAEGWYSYQVCGVDIFGRYSPNSDPAPWQEWSPAPDRPPWYWGRRTAPIVHPFAVGLLDKMPPPPPTGVEAFALDPADPFLVKDDAHTTWWNTLTASAWYQNLSEEEQKLLIGLRVRWLWTETEAVQAPDTSEFRIYFQPGPWNAVLGRITGVAPVAGQADRSTVTVQTGTPNTRGSDAYKGASLRIGSDAFPILASSAGDPLVLTVQSGPIVTTGKVDVEDGSPRIKGTGGTGWTKTLVGLTFQVNGEQISYRVLKLDETAQEITLDAPYRGLSGNKNYIIAGKLPQVGQPCSVVVPSELAKVFPGYQDYQHPTAWAQRIAAVDFGDHVAPVLQPARDRNGLTLRGDEATANGNVVALVDLPPDADLASLDLAGRVRTLCLSFTTAAGPAKTYRVLAVDPKAKTVTLDGAPFLTALRSPWLLGYPARRYEIFLPDPNHAQPAGLSLAPSLAEPILYGSIGVSAADDKAHTLDDARWQGTTWGGRPGNEGQVSAPVTVYCVLRRPPDPPAMPVFDSDKLFATRADYHSHSFYTVRWTPAEHLKVHVFWALDEALYLTDWAWRKTKSPPFSLSVSDKAYFPEELCKSDSATVARLNDAIQRINDLNNLDAAATRDIVLAKYLALTNDAKRILANLPGNERAFMQITVEPLDPDAPETANARSPDDPDDADVDDGIHPLLTSSLRRYVDTLDGRSSSAYFYRVMAVDGAHNRSALSLSTPPVYCPDVTPPRAPVMTKVVGGERKVTLSWASNREPDLLEYRVFRAGSAEDARDLRSMTQVAVVAADHDPSARPADVVWTDEPVRGLVNYWYRVVAVDRSESDPVDPRAGGGNVSVATPAVKARAVDTTPPNSPTWIVAERRAGGGVRLAWRTDETDITCIVYRRLLGGVWRAASQGLVPSVAPFDFEFVDLDAAPDTTFEYRIVVEDSADNRNRDTEVRTA